MKKFIDFLCLGRESNPYGHFWPRDFKSRVSTYSTTKANRTAKIVKNRDFVLRWKKYRKFARNVQNQKVQTDGQLYEE